MMKHIDREGKVIEISRSRVDPISVYGLVELKKAKIRLVGSIIGDQVKSGDRVFLSKCGYDSNNSIYFEFFDINSNSRFN
jgi:hypothetical protein